MIENPFRKMNRIKLSSVNSRRGISELMTMVFLLGIVSVGTLSVFFIFQSSDIVGIARTIPESSLKSVLLTGYDTRDSNNLSGITNLSNKFDNVGLCTTSCSVNKDLIPANGGTDFVVLRLRNTGLDPLFLSSIIINDQIHTFDFNTSGPIDGTTNAQSCTVNCPYPKSGKFSIVSDSNQVNPPVQITKSEVVADQEVRIVVKLSSAISPDIALNKALIVGVDTNRLEQARFVVPAGGTT